ncbi:OX-2 membrane glycoprotein isoform X2 [Alosa sapidissima]|uniref:OX-2 membrane glycoprotein isoform X2 n=1 Tax=Alosa sapidissima TaxID=34773 RepID=UPI001C08A0D3|nr:OX-2 membrane glycoprotein isoform X2 [Alosa sapidissima]
MFESGWCLCFHLWLFLLLFSKLQVSGKVSAPSHLQAIAGQPFMIGCNITIGPGQSLSQVRWMDARDVTILSYLADEPSRVTGSNRVELATFHSHTSAIRIKRAGPQDDGCYRCIFDVYPTGQQEGRTCLTVLAKVTLDGNKTVVSGKHTTLTCSYALSEHVQQVLWTKTAEQGDTTTVASYAKQDRPIVEEPFRGHVTLSSTLDRTQLFLRPVTTEDEGCYTCQFHTYPEGIRGATACLTVYVLPKPEVIHVTVSPGIVEVNCTTVSRPASKISWNVEGDNRTMGPSVSSYFEQGDGTTLVVSSILVQDRLMVDKTIKCLVHHQGLASVVTVPVNKIRRTHIILIVMMSVALALLLCLCVFVSKCSPC